MGHLWISITTFGGDIKPSIPPSYEMILKYIVDAKRYTAVFSTAIYLHTYAGFWETVTSVPGQTKK